MTGKISFTSKQVENRNKEITPSFLVISKFILFNAFDVTSKTCRNYAVVTQVMLLAGEKTDH